jgi:catalase
MQWDFWTLSPETAHQVAYLMGDRGVPRSWRHMYGYSSHTNQWLNEAGERFWVQYHFIADQGVENITAERAEILAGEDADFYIRDLYNAIKRGEHPSWTMKVQIMPYADAAGYRFNPFDLTKVWPHADYPLIEVGRFTLNRNPENYFAQIEQAAFKPSNLVPGVAVSPDKMLLARMFAYDDAHRYRVGANSAQLPVNAPKAPVNSYSRDGAMRFDIPVSDAPVYAPNSLGGPVADPARASESRGWESDGDLLRSAASLHADDDDFGQAGALVREIMDEASRARLIDTLVGQYQGLTRPEVKTRFLEYWGQIDENTAAAIRRRVAA